MKRIISVALVLVVMFTLAINVAAAESPRGKDYYKITVGHYPADGSLGDASSDKDKVEIKENPDGTVTLTAKEKGNGTFIKWVISGDYDIVTGSLTSKSMTIIPKSDIHADAYFEAPGSTPDSPSNPNTDKTSPKTGDPMLLVFGIAALALGVGVFAVKKIKE